jgi:hypothetical protein
MEYLTVDDLEEMNVIDYKSQKLLLVESSGPKTTFIFESDNDIDIDLSAKVFIRQRWLVDILPPDKFTKTFTTHKYIEVYYCTYAELLQEQERVYTSRDVMPHKEIDSNKLSDNFNGY